MKVQEPRPVIILRPPENEPSWNKFIHQLTHSLDRVRVNLLSRLDELERAVPLGDGSKTLMVLFVENEQDLDAVNRLAGADHLVDLILLVPEREESLKNRARLLRPRYIAALPGELPDLPLLLEAAVGKIRRLEITGS